MTCILKEVEALLKESRLVVYGGQPIKEYKEYLSCKIVDTGISLYREQLAFAMQKNSPYFEAFSFHINRMKESGYVQRHLEKYEHPPQVCPDYSGNPISLKQCFTTFFVIITGVIVSSVWLIMETWLPRRWITFLNRFFDNVIEPLNSNGPKHTQIRRCSI